MAVGQNDNWPFSSKVILLACYRPRPIATKDDFSEAHEENSHVADLHPPFGMWTVQRDGEGLSRRSAWPGRCAYRFPF